MTAANATWELPCKRYIVNTASWHTVFSESTHSCALHLCCVGTLKHEKKDDENMEGRERGKRARIPVGGEGQQRVVKSPCNCRREIETRHDKSNTEC